MAGQTQPVRPPCTWPDSPPGATLLVRGESLAASMSDYRIAQLKATPNIGVGLRTRVADGHGGQARLEALALEDIGTGQREQVPAAAVLVMIGAGPRTQWRRDLVKLNDRGFVLTGCDVPPGAHGRCPVRPCRLRRACQAIKSLAAQIRVICVPRAGPDKAIACIWGRQVRRRSGCAASSRCAGVQVRSRFRNLRGSAAGLPPG